MADVLFTGEFDLSGALAEFGNFANAIQTRLDGVNKTISANRKVQASEDIKEAQRTQQIITQSNATEAAKRRKNSIDEYNRQLKVQKDYDAMTQKEITDAQALEAKRRSDARIADFKAQQAASEKSDADHQARVKQVVQQWESGANSIDGRIAKSQQAIGDGFINLAIRSYALHQFGRLLEENLTQPLIRVAENIYQTTLRFDQFETLLRVRGGKSLDQVAASMDTVGRVAKLRNLDLEQSVLLYSRLFEATKGAIDDKTFETFGKGLSNIMSTLEASEKRSFFGQVQDILGGGQVANINKTLSLTPLLKKTYDDLQLAAGGTLTQQEALIKSFEKLAELPAINDLTTKIKNLGVDFELFGQRIGEIFKQQLTDVVDFIDSKVIPMVDNLVTKFEHLSPAMQDTALGIAAIAAAIGPLVSTVGTLILLFPNLTAESSFLSGAVELLAQLPALINPITAVVAAIIAILGKAFSNNSGGFRDALNFLIDALGNTLLTLLDTIFQTVTSIVSLVVNLFNAIDSIIPLTETIGTIGTILAYVLGTVLQLVNLLQLIPATIQFIADLLHGDVDLAFAKISLTILKVLNSITIIGKLVEAIFGVDLKKMISDAEREVAHLDGTLKDTNDSTQTAIGQNELLNNAYKQQAKAIDTITKAIQEQNKEIDIQIVKNRQAAAERQSQLAAYVQGQVAESYGQDVSNADLTSPSGQARAQEALANQIGVLNSSAMQQQADRVQKAVHDFLEKRREKILEVLKSETKEDGNKLDEGTKLVYEAYDAALKNALLNNTLITPENSKANLFDFVNKTLADASVKGKISDQELRLLITQLTNEKTLIAQVYNAENANNKEVLSAQQKADQLRRQLQESIDKANKQNETIGTVSDLQNKVSDVDFQIEQIQNRRSSYLSLTKEIQNLTGFIGQLNGYEQELEKKENEKAELQKRIAGAQYKNAAEYNAAIDKINTENKITIQKLRDQNQSDQEKIYRNISKTNQQLQQQLGDSLKDLLSYKREFIDILPQLAAGGGKVDFNKVADAFNGSIDLLFNLSTGDRLGKLQNVGELVKTFRTLGDVPAKIAEPIKAIINGFSSIGQIDLIDPTKRKQMIDQSQDVIKLLFTFANTAKNLTKEDSAQLQIFIDTYIDFIKSLEDGQRVLSQKIDPQLQILQSKESELQVQQNINQSVADELQMVQQILQLRQERGYLGDLKGVSDFGHELIDVLTGGKKAQYEIQKQILEQQKQSAKIETDIAITRLQIEQEILLLKLKEAGVSQTEIDKTKDEFEKQIDAVKEKGALQQILLDEQIKSLSKFGTDIGGIIVGSIASALGSIFKKKKKGSSTSVSIGGISGTSTSGAPGDDTGLANDDGTAQAMDDQAASADDLGSSLDDLSGKYGAVASAAGAFGKALVNMNDLSIKSIRNAVAEALKSIAQEAAVRALQYAAIAISALVFGDYHTAAKAGLAAAAWGGVAAAAYIGAALIGTSDAKAASNSSQAQSQAAQTTTDATKAAVLKQQSLSVFIKLDIRTDDGLIVKKNIKAINQNTNLTTLVSNSQEGWAFAPTP